MTGGGANGVHLSGYQARDREVVDYRMATLADTGLQFRGPLPDLGKPYFVSLGAAQTLGCFCEAPYPSLLSRALDLPALNLGYGGAGPEFFLRQEALLPIINRARFAVIQVMSARSQSNSYYHCDGLEYVTLRENGQRMGAQAAFERLVGGPTRLGLRAPLPYRMRRALADTLARPDPRLPALVKEIQEAWVASSLTLLSRIKVPTLLLWFSRRTPAYRQRYGTAVTTLGEFPQLVNAQMVGRLLPKVDAYVECVSSRGSPQPLVSRFTGEPTTVKLSDDRTDLGNIVWRTNMYYPSPQMHEDAAEALLGALRDRQHMFHDGRVPGRPSFAGGSASTI